MMKRWKIIIEYKGTRYKGWQRQKGGLSTVQQCIEEALHGFCQQDITLYAAGRTDSGVHAKGQIAHFDLDYQHKSLTPFELTKAINAHLRDEDIRIVASYEVDDDFHARHSAKNKLYTYRIIRRSARPALERNMVWHFKRDLDVKAMADAASVLIGKHDFSTFRDSQCQSNSPIKTLNKLWVETHDYDDHGGKEILIHAEAQSFLHHQVRNIVGSLVMVGEGKWSKEDLKQALDAKDRTAGGPTAPADGLYLVRIDYPK